jgi:histidine ammonia-lyase
MITLSKKQYTLEEVWSLVHSDEAIQLGDDLKSQILHCHSYLQSKMAGGNEVYYGINTGFGSLCNVVIGKDELSQLQYNLIRSHACGMGEYVPKHIVKIMMILKVLSLAQGHSGVSIATVEQIITLYNANILPVIYTQGSLGASGDLAPLAHLSLVLIGEGEVWENDTIIDGSEALKKHQIKPIELGAKEGLALLNGTQFMLAYALHNYIQAQKLLEVSISVAAMSIDAFSGLKDPFNALIHQARNNKSQAEIAARICKVLDDSAYFQESKAHVQDPYSFRCIPQVFGASLTAIQHAKVVYEADLNAVTDNPNVFPEEDLILSGGNFHGQNLALVGDYLNVAMAELGNISERRTYLLISGQRGLPAFLCLNPGLHSGYMIPQYTAASIVSENKTLLFPSSADSIPSSNGQEDHVSMGSIVQVKGAKIADNVLSVLAIELMNANQALHIKGISKTSSRIKRLIMKLNIDINSEDRVLQKDISKAKHFLSTNF